MIKRIYDLDKLIKPNKILVIYGPRQVGKATLLNKFLSNYELNYKLDSRSTDCGNDGLYA